MKKSVSTVNLNRNVNWLSYPGFWAFYIGLIVTSWLLISALVDDSGLAWTYVHLLHGAVTYYFLHWTKGSHVPEDQGKYDLLTFWEQIDNQTYATATRKFLTVVPVVLFIIATHATDFRKQPLGLNVAVVMLLVLAKLPALHKVRIFGINKY